MEETLVWNSLEDAQDYAKTVKAYIGQVLSVVTETESKVYVINDAAGNLTEIGANIDIGHTHVYTPSGTVSTPTIEVIPNTESINSITAAGEVPALSYTATTASNINEWAAGSGSASLTASVSDGPNRVVTLTFTHEHISPTLKYTDTPSSKIDSWKAGSTPTYSDKTVVTGIKSATASQPTFEGTEAIISFDTGKES